MDWIGDTSNPPTTHTHTHPCIIYHGEHDALIIRFKGRQTAEQQMQRCNGFVSIAPGDQYRAALVSYSHGKKSPRLQILVCHNTFSISSPPVSFSKLTSSHPFLGVDSPEHILQVFSAFERFGSPCTDAVCLLISANLELF